MTISIDPVIGTLGPLVFRWYGIIMALALLVGIGVMSWQLKVRHIDRQHAIGIAVFGVPLGVLGARLVHVLDHLGYYLDNPDKIFGTQLVGLGIYGVVGGGLLGLILYCWWRKLPIWRVLDSTALAFPVAQIIGRCANIINGDTWGSATDLPWGITYTASPFIDSTLLGVPTHPTPVYEQLWLLVVVGTLLLLMRRLRTVDGLAILSYVWLYSVGRFVISFYRENDAVLWGLNEAQVIALVMFLAVPPVAYWLVKRAKKCQAQRRVKRPGKSPGKPSGGPTGKSTGKSAGRPAGKPPTKS